MADRAAASTPSMGRRFTDGRLFWNVDSARPAAWTGRRAVKLTGGMMFLLFRVQTLGAGRCGRRQEEVPEAEEEERMLGSGRCGRRQEEPGAEAEEEWMLGSGLCGQREESGGGGGGGADAGLGPLRTKGRRSRGRRRRRGGCWARAGADKGRSRGRRGRIGARPLAGAGGGRALAGPSEQGLERPPHRPGPRRPPRGARPPRRWSVRPHRPDWSRLAAGLPPINAERMRDIGASSWG